MEKKMKTRTMIITLSVAFSAWLVITIPASAHWDTTQPAKWVQMPDETSNGMDVAFHSPNQQVFLGDDFECTQTGLITDIHIWGSWLHDETPWDNLPLRLSIWSDKPATPYEPSQPADLLWDVMVTDPHAVKTAWRHWKNVPDGEGWYDPVMNQYIPNADFNIWQYNFIINPDIAFRQEGNPDRPLIYWLVIDIPVDMYVPFGWKTRTLDEEQFNDDAVWGFLGADGTFQWTDMHYPRTHPNEDLWGKSFDLAFVITPEPGTIALLTIGGLAILRRRR